VSAELRREWVCEGCPTGTRARNACGDPIPEPEGWEGGRCWDCAREAAHIERAQAEEDVIVERVAAIDRLLTEDPGRTNKEIEGLVSGDVTSGEITERRNHLGLPSAGNFRRKSLDYLSPESQRIRDRLESGPLAVDTEVAAETGTSVQSVRKVRRMLGLEQPKRRCDGCGRFFTTGGTYGKHQKSSGHEGITLVPVEGSTVGSN
jgi:hypothetical protein